MDYFDILDFKREPFSNSPDPDFFYQSGQHTGCLQQLELAIRLRRGLNVVIGDVGTGKTTLCRELIRRFENDAQITTYLMLDPGAGSDSTFLSSVVGHFLGQIPPDTLTDDRKKEAIKQFLFEAGVKNNQTTVLIIDEGQKISPSCLEILREFLNYETNAHKLLQIVIFAQKEFDHIVAGHPNFTDRINLRLEIKPLGFIDTRALIRYRVEVSGGGSVGRLFSIPALLAIYLATRGYPRRIIHLCHRILLTLIIQNRHRAGWRIVRSSARRTAAHQPVHRWRWVLSTGLLVLITAMLLAPGEVWRTRLKPAVMPVKPIETSSASSVALAKTPPEAPALGDASVQAKPSAPAPEPATLAVAVRNAPALATAQAAAAAPEDTITISQTQMPARLGRVIIRPRETLGHLIKTIYGQFEPPLLKAIEDANPHIPNPDTLQVGDVIHFPAVPAAIHPLSVNVWWVQLAEHRRLGDAVRELKQSRRNHIPARLVPYWNPQQGLVFSLVLADCYYDRQAADSARAIAVPEGYPDARTHVFRQDDTVFFSDPFRAVSSTTRNRS